MNYDATVAHADLQRFE